MAGTFSGRGHVAAAATALVTVGLLAAVPPGQSAPAGGWGPTERIAAVANLNRYGPYNYDPVYNDRQRPALVRIRANGSAVTAWISPRPRPWRLMVAQRATDGRWRRVRDLSSGVTGRVGPFDVAVGGGGLASVVWQTNQRRSSWIEESHLARGTWSEPERLGRGAKPLATIDSGGVTTVLWTHHGLWMAERAPGSGWSRPALVVGQDAGHLDQLQLASNPSGDLAAAWAVDGERVMAAFRPHGSGSWSTPVALESTVYVSSVRLGMDASGRALAVWSAQKDESRAYLRWSRSTPEGRWTTSRELAPDIGADGALVGVSVNAGGLAVASWMNLPGGSDGWASLWAARFGATGTWSPPARVSPELAYWFDASPWMDDAGVAHVLAARGRSSVWAFLQKPGAAWTGRNLNRGSLISAEGLGSRLAVVFYRKHALRSRILDLG